LKTKQKGMAWLPVFLIIPLVGWFGWGEWQSSQLARPDYDHPEQPLGKGRGLLPSSGSSEQAEVISVMEGDVLVVRRGQTEKTLRLCGIDAPGLEQPLGQQAKQKLQEFATQAQNKIIYSPSGQDQQGRWIAEVFISAQNSSNPEEEKMLNYEMVATGMARVHPLAHNCPNGELMLNQAESDAKLRHQGLWTNSPSFSNGVKLRY